MGLHLEIVLPAFRRRRKVSVADCNGGQFRFIRFLTCAVPAWRISMPQLFRTVWSASLLSMCFLIRIHARRVHETCILKELPLSGSLGISSAPTDSCTLNCARAFCVLLHFSCVIVHFGVIAITTWWDWRC